MEVKALEGCPIEFVNGVYCRSILNEPTTDLLTLYGVLPAFAVGVKPNTQEAESTVEIPVGQLAIYLCFRRAQSAGIEHLKVPIRVTFEFPGRKTIETELLVEIGYNYVIGQASFVLPDLVMNLEYEKGSRMYWAKFKAKYKDEDFFTVSLPVKVEML